MNSCKDCTDRHLYCHDTCERYKADCAERAAIKKKRKEALQYEEYAESRRRRWTATRFEYEKIHGKNK